MTIVCHNICLSFNYVVTFNPIIYEFFVMSLKRLLDNCGEFIYTWHVIEKYDIVLIVSDQYMVIRVNNKM